jgi:hypothetical protein
MEEIPHNTLNNQQAPPAKKVSLLESLLTVIGISLFGILVIIIFLVVTFFTYLWDSHYFIVAKSITRYPNASLWNVHNSACFSYFTDCAEVQFNTTDSGQTVLDFYEKDLKKRGWKEVSSSGEKLIFKKTLSATNYTLSVPTNDNGGFISVTSK